MTKECHVNKLVLIAAVLLSVIEARAPRQKQDLANQDELRRLEGEWFVKSAKWMKINLDLTNAKWVFKGTQFSTSLPGRDGDDAKWEIKVDCTKEPKHIDLISIDNPKEKTPRKAIYAVTQNELKLAFTAVVPDTDGLAAEFSEYNKNTRPKDFSSDIMQVVITLERRLKTGK